MAKMMRVKALATTHCALCGREFASNEDVYEWVPLGHRVCFCKECRAKGPRAFVQKEKERVFREAETALFIMETQDPNAIYYPRSVRGNIQHWFKKARRLKCQKATALKTLWALEHWVWPVLYHAKRAGWL